MKTRITSLLRGRNVLGLLFALSAVQAAQAQDDTDYYPFVEEGKTWTCSAALMGDYWSVTYDMAGDTVIAGTAYKKVYCTNQHDYGDDAPCYVGAVREEARMVYGLKADSEAEQVLYDFRPDGGGVDYPNGMVAGRGDAFIGYLRGEPRRCFHVHPSIKDSGEHMTTLYTWIEGVGSIEENPFPFTKPFGTDEHLSECRVGDRLVFDFEDQFFLWDPDYRGSDTGVDDTRCSRSATGHAYDLQGRLVNMQSIMSNERGRNTAPLWHGLYIRDRRKYAGAGGYR